EQKALVPTFDPNEPLPPMETSRLAIAPGPLRHAIPPSRLTNRDSEEPPAAPGGGGGSALPVAGGAFLLSLPHLPPGMLAGLAGLLPFVPTNRGADLPPDDFLLAQDALPPDRSLPTGGNPSSGGDTSSSWPTPADTIRDWTQNPDTSPTPPIL